MAGICCFGHRGRSREERTREERNREAINRKKRNNVMTEVLGADPKERSARLHLIHGKATSKKTQHVPASIIDEFEKRAAQARTRAEGNFSA